MYEVDIKLLPKLAVLCSPHTVIGGEHVRVDFKPAVLVLMLCERKRPAHFQSSACGHPGIRPLLATFS